MRGRIDAVGRGRRAVTVVAVTKSFPPAYAAAAAACGLTKVGENYASELASKRGAVALPLTWHYLGALQRNKLASLCQNADVLCTLSRSVEVDALARRVAPPPVYVQVDFTGAPGRGGVAEGDLEALVAHATATGLDLRGLLTVAPIERAAAAAAFARLAAHATALSVDVVSMGMSDDFELAVAAGATEVRLGRALFGARGA